MHVWVGHDMTLRLHPPNHHKQRPQPTIDKNWHHKLQKHHPQQQQPVDYDSPYYYHNFQR